MTAQIISFHCVLKNKLGAVLGRTFNQNVFSGVKNAPGALRALDESIQGIRAGELRKVELSAEQAYGLYDTKLVIETERSRVPHGKKLRVGDTVELTAADGRVRQLTVIGASGEKLRLDGNHPLAGQDLTFEIRATQAREATSEELREAEREARFGRAEGYVLH